MLVGEARLAFLDVETTGLAAAMGDWVIEIGIIACQGERERGRQSRLVNPERPIPNEARQVHGIAADRRQAGRQATFSEARKRLLQQRFQIQVSRFDSPRLQS